MSKKNFVIGDYKEEYISMFCKNKQECEEFCRYLASIGRTWRNGDSYLVEDRLMGDKTNIYFYFNNGTWNDTGNECIMEEDEIENVLKWEEFKLDKFTKSDLKTGDVIICKNKEKYIVIKEMGSMIGQRGYDALTNYNEKLENTIVDELTIMKVYRPREMHQCRFDAIDGSKGDLVFDRDRDYTTIEMTLEEICKALGRNVKIVK